VQVDKQERLSGAWQGRRLGRTASVRLESLRVNTLPPDKLRRLEKAVLEFEDAPRSHEAHARGEDKMADSDHVAAVADLEAERHPETEIDTEAGNGHQVVRGAGPATPSPPRHAQDREGAESTGEFQHEHGGSASPRSDLYVEPCVP